MQKKIYGLLLILCASNIFAGKKEQLLLKKEAYRQTVAGKYHLMMREPLAKIPELSAHNTHHQGETIDTCAWQALRAKCKQLSSEKEKYARENEELRQLRIENQKLKQLLAKSEKQEQLSSSDSSPISIIAISPTNESDAQQLKSPDEMHLQTPELRVRTPIQSSAHRSYYYEYPTNGRILGMSLGINDFNKTNPYDDYLPVCYPDCP